MKRIVQVLLGLVAGSCFTALAFAAAPAASKTPAAPKTPAPPPLSPRFIQIRDKINTLFQHRNDVSPAPDPRANPFRPAGATVTPGVAPQPVLANDLAQLQQAVATLRVSGTVERDDQPYVVVNNRTYKQKDIIPTRVGAEMVYLKVGEITRHTLTLSLNEAELTLKF